MRKGKNRMVITAFIEDFLTSGKIKIFGNGKQKIDFIHVLDVVKGLILGMESSKGSGEIFNLGRGKTVSLNELCHMIAEDPVIEYQKSRMGDPGILMSDNSKILSTFDWAPSIDLDESIKELIKEYKITNRN